MRTKRFLIGLGLEGAALGLLLLALAVERTEFFRRPAVSVAYLIAFSLLGIAGVVLMWSDHARKPVRWVVAIAFSLVWASYHLVLVRGPG